MTGLSAGTVFTAAMFIVMGLFMFAFGILSAGAGAEVATNESMQYEEVRGNLSSGWDEARENASVAPDRSHDLIESFGAIGYKTTAGLIDAGAYWSLQAFDAGYRHPTLARWISATATTSLFVGLLAVVKRRFGNKRGAPI